MFKLIKKITFALLAKSSVAVVLISFGFITPVKAQLTMDSTLSPSEYVSNVLLGAGVTEVKEKTFYFGSPNSMASFSGNSNIGFSEGLFITNGAVRNAIGPNDSEDKSFINTQPGDADLDGLTNAPTTDATALEFQFTSLSDSVSFRYVFASEEYPEFVNAGKNDVFGFFISGPGIVGKKNIAFVPGTTTPVSIDNVNPNINSAFYVDNTGGQTIQFDGFTTPMIASFRVIPCQTYTIKLAIADVGDPTFDSGVFFEKGSFSSKGSISVTAVPAPTVKNPVEGCSNGAFVFSRNGDLTNPLTVKFDIGGAATGGADYVAFPDSFTIPAGLASDTLFVTINDDNIPEADEELSITLRDTTVCMPVADFIFIRDYTTPSMEVSENDTICEGEAVVVTAGGKFGSNEFKYTWTTSEGETADGSSFFDIPDTTTFYFVEMVDLCKGDTIRDTVMITVKPVTIVADIFPKDTFLCAGDQMRLEVVVDTAVGNVEFAWAPEEGLDDPTAAVVNFVVKASGGYKVEVTDSNECPVVLYSNVKVLEAEILKVSPICIGDSVVLKSTNNDPTGVTYDWSPTQFLNDGTIAEPTANISETQTFQLILTSQTIAGCMDTATVEVNVDTLPIPMVVDPEPICQKREQAQLFVSGGLQYEWNPRGTVSNPNLPDPLAFPIATTTYKVKVFNGACMVEDSSTVKVVIPNEIDFTFEIADECDRIVEFVSNISAESTIKWYLGDGDTSNLIQFGHAYPASELYEVRLVINEGITCEEDTLFEVNFDKGEISEPKFPNIFTPNGDRTNDFFELKPEEQEKLKCDFTRMVIYNRWGVKVFETKDKEDFRWAGVTMAGEEVSEGVYFYVIEVKGETLKGTVTVKK